MQLYKVLKYTPRGYKTLLYSSMFDHAPVTLYITSNRINKFISDKMDKSELEGNKVNIRKLKEDTKSNKTRSTTINISNKEKDILKSISNSVSNTYATENDLIDLCNSTTKHSKALIRRTVRNKDIMKMYNLKRIRANKELKENYNIDSRGYPYIVVAG